MMTRASQGGVEPDDVAKDVAVVNAHMVSICCVA